MDRLIHVETDDHTVTGQFDTADRAHLNACDRHLITGANSCGLCEFSPIVRLARRDPAEDQDRRDNDADERDRCHREPDAVEALDRASELVDPHHRHTGEFCTTLPGDASLTMPGSTLLKKANIVVLMLQ